LITVALGLLLAAGVNAGPWELSLAASYRSVGDLELDRIQFTNPSFADSMYVNGAFDGASTPQVIYVANLGFQNGTTYTSLSTLEMPAGDEGLDSALGLTLAARRSLGERWGMPWFLGLNLTWFGTDASVSGMVSGTPYYWNIVPGTWGYDGANSAIVANGPVQDGHDPLGLVYGTYDLDLDLDAYTFGLGLGTDVAVPFGSLRLEAGPTLTLADYSTNASYAARWVNGDTAVYTPVDRSDSGLEWHAGLYGDLSFVFDLSETLGVGVGVRYDYVFEKVDTDIGDIDLSGFSASAKVLYRF
jgi:hypothetical protein